MANRRMFSQRITGDERFLEMPVSAQNLYFHLGIYADDDGFVNPQKVIRMIGSNPDDLKILLTKGFVIPFECGVIVITHWKENNYIQSDRYTPTIYQKEYQKLECIQNVYKVDTQVRLGKVRKEIGEIAETGSAPWVLEDKLLGMETKEGGYLDFIASFIREKPVKVENAKQLSAVISRYCRVAKQLEGAYQAKQVFGAIDEIKKNNEKRRANDRVDWTLETVFKKLTK